MLTMDMVIAIGNSVLLPIGVVVASICVLVYEKYREIKRLGQEAILYYPNKSE